MKRIGDLAQGLIPDVMPETVVDGLEVVRIDDEQSAASVCGGVEIVGRLMGKSAARAAPG